MPKLLACALSGDKALLVAPELLAIRVPQFWDREDGTRAWLTGCDVTPVWGMEGRVSLGIGGADVVYRLRAYIQYILPSADVEPSVYMRSAGGHFVAHFEASGSWFVADDLGQHQQIVRWESDVRHEIPFVIIISIGTHWEDPVRV